MQHGQFRGTPMWVPPSAAIANEDESAGAGLQHKREILRAHHRRHVGIDPLASDHLGGDRGRKRSLRLGGCGSRDSRACR